MDIPGKASRPLPKGSGNAAEWGSPKVVGSANVLPSHWLIAMGVGEGIARLGFIACQAYLTATYGFLKVDKLKAVGTGPVHHQTGQGVRQRIVQIVNLRYWQGCPVPTIALSDMAPTLL